MKNKNQPSTVEPEEHFEHPLESSDGNKINCPENADLSYINLLKMYNEYTETIDSQVKQLDDNLNINSIEKLLGDTKKNMNSILEDRLHDALSKLNEQELIRKKNRI